MAQLPTAEALGETPIPVLPRRTPMLAYYRPTTGFEDFGAQEMNRSAGELDTASRVAMQAKEQQDSLRAEDAFTQLRQQQINMTYGDNGFMRLQGGDAVNQPLLKNYGQQFDQAAAQIGGTLDNAYQQQIFQRRAQIAGLQLREDITRHVAGQVNVYADNVFRAKIDTEVQAAAARWTAPDAAQVPLLNIDNAISDYAARTGKPQEWVDDSRMKAQDAVYGAMVKQAIAVDPDTARKLFDTYSDKMLATTRASLDQTIESRAYTQMMRQEIIESRAERQAEKQLRTNQTANESGLLADVLAGKTIDSGRLSGMLRSQQISPPGMGAILSLQRRGEDLPDNSVAALDLYKKFADHSLSVDDVYTAAIGGHIKGSTAKSLMVGIANQQNRSDTAEARGYYGTLRTIFQGAGIDQGLFVKDPDTVDRWVGVQKEWNEQVNVQGKDPQTAFNDIVGRFQPPGHPPATWEQPKYGAIINQQDIAGAAARTEAAYRNGDIPQGQYEDQKKLILQYNNFFTQKAREAAALRVAKQAQQSGAKTQARPPIGEIQPAPLPVNPLGY